MGEAASAMAFEARNVRGTNGDSNPIQDTVRYFHRWCGGLFFGEGQA
jgi:hypothetical protein